MNKNKKRLLIILAIFIVFISSRQRTDIAPVHQPNIVQSDFEPTPFERLNNMTSAEHVQSMKKFIDLIPKDDKLTLSKKQAEWFSAADKHYQYVKTDNLFTDNKDLVRDFVAAKARYSSYISKGINGFSCSYGHITLGDSHDSVISIIPNYCVDGQTVSKNDFGPVVQRNYKIDGKNFTLTFGKKSANSPHIVLKIEEL